MQYFSILKKRDFFPFFLTQFFSAFADNLFKTSLLFLATFDAAFKTDYSVPVVSALISAVFILPFLIFAAPAGQVANHYENSWLARIFKRCEVFIIIIAWIGLSQGSFWIMLLSLFLSSTQATFFGPIKYSLIPAYLGTKDRIAGNGLIESSTFFAILLGTLVGGLLPKEYLGLIMFISSLLCLYSSEKMVKTDVELLTTPIDFNILKSTRKLIRFALKDRVLFLTIVGISWFWFIGCIILTAIVPYTEQVINGEKEIASFFLFAFTVGIAAGSYLGTMLLRGNLHNGYVPVAGFFMSVLLFDFVTISDTVKVAENITLGVFLTEPYSWRIFFDLFMLAVFSGLYTVPLYATIQERLNPARRGMGISANNMLNALFMVVASLGLMILSALDFSLLQILFLTASLNIVVTLKIANYVPESIRQMLVQFVFSTFFRVDVVGIDNIKKAGSKSIIIANHTSFLDGLLLFAYLPSDTGFVIYHQYASKWFAWVSKGVKIFFIDPDNPMAMKHILKHLAAEKRIVIFPEGRMTSTGSLMKINDGPSLLAERTNATILPICIEGAARSRLTRLKGMVKRTMFPKITLYIQDPIKIDEFKGDTPRITRANISQRIERLMEEMAFECSPYQSSLFTSLLDAAKHHGRFTKAMEGHDFKSYSYQSLITKSCILGAYFSRITDEKEEVGVLLPTSCPTVISFFGLISHGRIPVMLNYSLGEERLMETINLIGIKTLITSHKFLENLPHLADLRKALNKLRINVVHLEDLKDKKSGQHSLTLDDKIQGLLFSLMPNHYYKEYFPEHDDLAVVLFTSGSEQTPKAVALSHENLNANQAQVTACLDFTAKDLLMNVLPIYHSFGLTAGVLMPLLSGVPVFLYPNPLHHKVIPNLAYDMNATLLFGTSSLLLKYAEAAHGYDFYSMRYVIAGAEKLSHTTKMLWQDKFGIRILEGYGMTEAAPAVAFNTPMHYKEGSVGKLVPGMTAKIKPIEGIKEGGELCLKGPNVMMGYYDGKTITPPNEEFGYETGDIVSLDKEGFITIQGRLKRFAKISGEMVPLTYVEELIHMHFSDYTHTVVAIPHDKRGEELVLVTTKPDLKQKDITSVFTDNKYPMLFCPKKIHIVDEIPLMGTGKVDVNTAKKMVLEA